VSLPELVTDPAAWQARCRADRESGKRIVLVPTMGYLHDGHLSLMLEARRLATPRGVAVASVFVNPTQFGPTEDLSSYPRDLQGDLEKLGRAGIDRVFAPTDPAQIFAPGHETWIVVEKVSQGLCGGSRPGHFRGVATVVSKLFNLTLPHAALFEARDAAARGERDAARLRARGRERLEAAGARVDYVEIVHPITLAPVERVEPGSIMLVAAFVGATRLIDNVRLP